MELICVCQRGSVRVRFLLLVFEIGPLYSLWGICMDKCSLNTHVEKTGRVSKDICVIKE